MATEPTTVRRPSFVAVALNYLSYLFLFAVCGVMLYLAWPMVHAQLTTTTTAPQALPTASVAPARPQSAPAALPTAPAIPGVAQNAATAQALYDAAVQAGEQAAPVPNTDATGDSAPVIVQSKPVERMPAGENVPTAEPIAPAESGGIFGNKPVLTNPQETHTCKHGQVWTERGCKNPTPIGGG